MLFLIFIWCLGCIGVLPTYVSLPGLCLVPVDARRGHQIPWNWGYKPLWAPWGLSSKSGSSGRANALIHRVTSHPPKKMIFFFIIGASREMSSYTCYRLGGPQSITWWLHTVTHAPSLEVDVCSHSWIYAYWWRKWRKSRASYRHLT